MADIEVKEGEILDVQFTITDDDGNAVDCSGATAIDFHAAENMDQTTYDIDKALADFTISGTSDNVLTVNVSFADLEGDYIGQLAITLAADDIRISKTITIYVEKSFF